MPNLLIWPTPLNRALLPDRSILTAEENTGGSDIESINYRLFNTEHDSGFISYTNPFSLSGLSDGTYTLEYFSTDVSGNVEATHTIDLNLDSSSPSISVIAPTEGQALQDVVNFRIESLDTSGTEHVSVSIREADSQGGIIIDPSFEIMSATYNADVDEWQLQFDTTLLPDGFYILIIEATDFFDYSDTISVSFSIRNWVALELLPATQDNNPGRTMPVKFSLRVVEAVDPAIPFVWNEELNIIIYDKSNPDEILRDASFGEASRDYRIDAESEHYITNFKTSRQAATYVVEIWRNGLFIGSFEFNTGGL